MSTNVEPLIDRAKADALSLFAEARAEEILLAAAERRLAVLDARRRLVLRAFNVTDVAKLGEKLAKNKFAAEKLHELFGGSFELLKDATGTPLMDVETITNDRDVGTYRIYKFFGRYTRADGKSVEQMGAFSTKDAFFARAHEQWKTIDDLNVVDVIQAAQTECYKKAIFRGCGLGDWTPEEARELAGKAPGHDFAGSAAGAGEKDAVIGFGGSKGKPPSALADQDLAWYAARYAENVADPAKARFLKANQKVLDAIRAEQERRGDPMQQRPLVEPPLQPTPAPSAPTGSSQRGQLLGDGWTRIYDLSQRNQKLATATVAAIARAWGREGTALSDYSTEDLQRLAALSDEELGAFVARATA